MEVYIMRRIFIESNNFKKLIDSIENLDIERIIKQEILKDPYAGDIIKETGGFRKIRIGKNGRGKSGGYRIIYLDFPDFGITYLYLVFEKSIKIDLTEKEKKWLRNQCQELKNALKSARR